VWKEQGACASRPTHKISSGKNSSSSPFPIRDAGALSISVDRALGEGSGYFYDSS